MCVTSEREKHRIEYEKVEEMDEKWKGKLKEQKREDEKHEKEIKTSEVEMLACLVYHSRQGSMFTVNSKCWVLSTFSSL